MKVLILILLLNAETGDIERAQMLGTAPNTQVCMQAAAKVISETQEQIGANVPFPVCLDIEPMIPKQAKKVAL